MSSLRVKELTKDECGALEAAKSSGFLVTHPSARRLRRTWRAYCDQADVAHAEALHRAHAFEFKLDLHGTVGRLSRDARRLIDGVFSLVGSNGSAGIAGAYAADIPLSFFEPVARIVLGIVGIDRSRVDGTVRAVARRPALGAMAARVGRA
jgi:hypothetical protein